MAKFLVLSAALLCLVGSAFAASVATSCVDGSDPEFDSVSVFVNDQECTTSPCDLVRGTTAKCLITFTTKNSISQLNQLINATVVGTGITTRFPVPDADKGCDKLTDSFCPLDKGETATIELAFDVLKIYPKVGLVLVIYLQDQNGNNAACMRLEGKVVD